MSLEIRCKVQSAIFIYYFKNSKCQGTVTSMTTYYYNGVHGSVHKSIRLSMQRWRDWIRLQYVKQAAY